MKRINVLFFTLLSVIAASAQRTPVEKYEIPPYGFEQVFLDGIEKNPSKILDTMSGQYIGQVDPNNYLYGYGMFIGNNGTHVTGKFHQGQVLFGITISPQNAIVGSTDYYVSYNLSTGQLEYIFRNNQKYIIEGETQNDYRFNTVRYMNGDQYTGEFYQGRRHGFGIYYYANGDFWFGEYNNDIRYGFGALYTMSNGLFVGEWYGEDVKRVIAVKRK